MCQYGFMSLTSKIVPVTLASQGLAPVLLKCHTSLIDSCITIGTVNTDSTSEPSETGIGSAISEILAERSQIKSHSRFVTLLESVPRLA